MSDAGASNHRRVECAPRGRRNLVRNLGRVRLGWVLLLLGAGVLLGGLALRPAKDAVRGAWNEVGLRRVEGHAGAIRAAAQESGVDANLLAAVMYAESRGQVDAVSSVGALGLYQLMESAAMDSARRLGVETPTREELLSNPTLNARLAASHLGWLLEHEGPELEPVLVAYNAGRTKLHRWVRKHGSYEAWRKKQVRDGDSQVLAYATQVLAVRERFIERGVIAPR